MTTSRPFAARSPGSSWPAWSWRSSGGGSGSTSGQGQPGPTALGPRPPSTSPDPWPTGPCRPRPASTPDGPTSWSGSKSPTRGVSRSSSRDRASSPSRTSSPRLVPPMRRATAGFPRGMASTSPSATARSASPPPAPASTSLQTAAPAPTETSARVRRIREVRYAGPAEAVDAFFRGEATLIERVPPDRLADFRKQADVKSRPVRDPLRPPDRPRRPGRGIEEPEAPPGALIGDRSQVAPGGGRRPPPAR